METNCGQNINESFLKWFTVAVTPIKNIERVTNPYPTYVRTMLLISGIKVSIIYSLWR